MQFSLSKSLEILERTPGALSFLLQDVSTDWTAENEGGETWSVYDIVGHLIEGEKSDWIPRMEIILSGKADKTFPVFDRYAQFRGRHGESLNQLLEEFTWLRKSNLEQLRSKKLNLEDLFKKGVHPSFGEVTLAQLLSTWTVHDLNHIAQICRVMAKQYKSAVGPWIEYLRVLQV